MTKIRLTGQRQVDYAMDLIRAAPENTVVSISQPRRSDRQNAKMWPMLQDIANAAPEGREYAPEVWKTLFMHSLGHQVQFAEGLDGNGPIPLGFRSSRLSVKQMIDLIEVIYEYGARHGVLWTERDRCGWGNDNA